MALCYYADINGKRELLRQTKQHLASLLDMHYILAELAYAGKAATAGTEYESKWDEVIAASEEHLYVAAYMGSLYGIEVNLEDFDNFDRGYSNGNYLESILNIGDTSPWPLKTDNEIMAVIQNELDGKDNEPWIVERYWEAFPDDPPVRRAGEGYEAQDWEGTWSAVENPWHQHWSAHKLLYEMPLCTNAPWVMSCEWAVIGCTPADFDASGTVDAADQTLHEDLLTTWAGTTCDAGNDWCAGADLDISGAADGDDRDFMTAAQGCVR